MVWPITMELVVAFGAKAMGLEASRAPLRYIRTIAPSKLTTT